MKKTPKKLHTIDAIVAIAKTTGWIFEVEKDVVYFTAMPIGHAVIRRWKVDIRKAVVYSMGVLNLLKIDDSESIQDIAFSRLYDSCIDAHQNRYAKFWDIAKSNLMKSEKV